MTADSETTRLFISIDMMGSTAFKKSFQNGAAAPWVSVYRTFFMQFPLILTGQVALEFEDHLDIPVFDVWKAMGDELIFACETAQPEHISGLLRAALSTMALYEAYYFSDLRLRLKATAWTAVFPNPNIEVEIPEINTVGSGRHTDFIGPDVDLGFRLSRHARPDSIVISMALAERILNAQAFKGMMAYDGGRALLPGVAQDRPYPLIYLAFRRPSSGGDGETDAGGMEANELDLPEAVLNIARERKVC